MNLFSVLAVSAPSSLWVTLINWIESSVGNLGWTIILVTLLIKVVTTPLDFFVKLNTKKQTLVQQKCSPQIAKLQKKYGEDRTTLRIQSQSIYKREGLDMRSGCIIMLINTILSLVIFITFYKDLQKVSAYEAVNQYEQIEAAYYDKYYTTVTNYSSTDEFISYDYTKEWLTKFKTEQAKVESGEAVEGSEEYIDYQAKKAVRDANSAMFEEANNSASQAALDCWNANKSDSAWLWVQNIWVADSTSSPFPTYSGLVSIAKNTSYANDVSNINQANYDQFAKLISDNSPRQNNGYYILPILAGLITFLSQYITELHSKLKNKKANQVAKTAGNETAGAMKMMKIIMPIIMVVFVLSSSASFGLYILSSNVASIVLGELTTFGVDKMTKKQRLAIEADLEKEANKMIKKGQLQVKE